MISPEEKTDVEKLVADSARQRELFFSLALEIDKADAAALKAMGFGGKPKDEAIADTYRTYAKAIRKLESAFVKKWPD